MSATAETRFLEALRRLRVRTDHLEEMAKWKEDLTSRLWRAEVSLRVTGKPLFEMEAMEAEVEAYKICCDKPKTLSAPPPKNEEDAA